MYTKSLVVLNTYYNTPLKLVCPLIVFTAYSPIKQTVDRCFSAYTTACANSCPFVVRILLLCISQR